MKTTGLATLFLALLLAFLMPQAADADIMSDLFGGILDILLGLVCAIPIAGDLLGLPCPLKIDYFEGIQLHFEISEEQARLLMPSQQFTPVKMRILQDGEESAVYMLSWYVARMGGNFIGFYSKSLRADLFIAAMDPSDELCIVFVAAIAEIPKPIRGFPFLVENFQQFLEGFALDSRTEALAYPQYYASTFEISDSGFQITVDDQSFGISTSSCTPDISKFTPLFVDVNRQTYKSPIDKHINFFDESFALADVFSLDLDCLQIDNLDSFVGFHPEGMGILHSAQAYGDGNVPIVWTYVEFKSSEVRRSLPSKKNGSVSTSNMHH